MRKLLKFFGLLLLLALVWLGLVLSEWLPRSTEAELTAMAVLESKSANVSGARNAFPAIWLMSYDVPDAELEAVAAADTAAFLDATKQGQVTHFTSTAEGKYAAVPGPPGIDPLLCETWGGSCLVRVRANPEASRARVAEFAKRLERGDRLAQYDHYAYGFRPRLDAPIGGASSFTLQLTAAALDYLDGNVDSAFARVCHGTATWRRLRAHSDALIMDMLGVAQMSGAAKLYAEMLAEQAPDFTPPCAETFAPLSDAEANQCAVFRGEFLFMRNTIEDETLFAELADSENRRSRLLPALINERHVVHASAPYFANQCTAENLERVRRRDPAPLPPVGDSPCGAMSWTFDPVGCHIALLSMPDYNDYYLRVLDLDARLKLLQSALWLRTQPADGDRAAQFAARPGGLQSTHHPMRYDSEHNMLRMTNLEKRRGEFWEIPFGVAAPVPAVTDAASPDSTGH